MHFEKMHTGSDVHRGVHFGYTISEHDGTVFSEVSYKLPHGPAIEVTGKVPYPTLDDAIAAVKKRSAKAIDEWLDGGSKH